jgi:hypothetical protein
LREKWTHPLAHEIVFDVIPGLPIYMEVDCTSEDNLNKMIDLLEVNQGLKRYGAWDEVFLEYYGITSDVFNEQTPTITFNNISNEIKATKNLDLLKIISEIQKKIENYNKNSSLEKYIDDYSKIYDEFIKNSIQSINISRSIKIKKSSSF